MPKKPPPTWRDIAIRLGERMRHHTFCPSHEENEADPLNCPFCDDRLAFQQYIAKRGKPS